MCMQRAQVWKVWKARTTINDLSVTSFFQVTQVNLRLSVTDILLKKLKENYK